jgi:Tfp pilus assembly protein PilF
MNRVKTLTAAAAVALAILTPQALLAADDLGTRAIMNQDWATAETQILAGLDAHPGDVFRLLNLAAVYGQTNREDEAAAIYRQILNSDESRVAALTSGQGQPVRDIAERGLSLLQE